MTEHSVKHSTFTLERTYSASPAQVFAAWADRDTKAKWFAANDPAYTLDFRVGGAEAAHGRTDDGAEIVAESATATSSPTSASSTPPCCTAAVCWRPYR